MTDSTAPLPALDLPGELDALDLDELAGLINQRIAGWRAYGYENPPTDTSATIPPLGDRGAAEIRDAQGAVDAIDALARKLHKIRSTLIGELRQNEDILMARLDERYGPIRTAPTA